MQPTILITRPDSAGLRFADHLRAELGCAVPMILSPVTRIEQCGTLPDLAGIEHLIFTSRNGVEAYAAKSTRRDIPCYTVGDATAELARSFGLSATSGSGNANDLIAKILADGLSGPCLHVRGKHGVGEIAAQLTKAGVETREVVLYRQVTQPLNADAKALLMRETPVILPLFSPRSARLTLEQLEGSAPLTVIAISAAVADEVTGGNVKILKVAAKPNARCMVDAVITLLDQAI